MYPSWLLKNRQPLNAVVIQKEMGKNDMDILNLIASICSIISLVVSFIAIKKVLKIEKKINIKNSPGATVQNVTGQNNITAGRNLSVKQD